MVALNTQDVYDLLNVYFIQVKQLLAIAHTATTKRSTSTMFAGGGTTHVSATERSASSSNAGASSGANAHGAPSYANAMAEANDLDALVFEFGTAKCKFGYAGEDFPRVYESALAPTASDDLHSERARADAAVQAAARMELEPEQLAQWLFDTAASRLQTRMSDHPLLLVERPFAIPDEIAALQAPSTSASSDTKDATKDAPTSVSSKKQHVRAREQLVEVLMEQLGIPALFCAKSAVLTCYANARTSGLVVDMGATYTSVTSVHEGYAFASPKSQTHVFGGHDLDAFLRQQLAPQLAKLADAASLDDAIARRMPTTWSYAVEAKESGLCRVADGAFDAAQNAQIPLITYELPDKTVIAMGTERFSVPEQYFVSSDASSSSSSTPPSASSAIVQPYEASSVKRGIALPEFICDVGGMTTEAELRKELFQNIVLTGGSSCFENMPTRLEREVASAIGTYQLPLTATGASSSNVRVKVVAAHAPERKIGAFLGGSILASLGSFHEMWMSKAEYAEHGAALVHKKCP